MKCIPGCIGAILLLATSLCAQPAAVAGMVLMYLATSSGITYGVVGVGDLQGGNGNTWLTFLGSALGVAAGATTAILTKSTAGYVTAGTLAVGTPVLFYHLSAEPVYEEHGPWTEWPYGSAIQSTGMHDHIPLLQLRIPLTSD